MSSCSQRVAKPLSVNFTNSSASCSMFENVARVRSPTRCGGTPNQRQISWMLNRRVSSNCASFALIPICLYLMSFSRIGALCGTA